MTQFANYESSDGGFNPVRGLLSFHVCSGLKFDLEPLASQKARLGFSTPE